MNKLKSDAITESDAITDLIEDNFGDYYALYCRFPVDLLVDFLLHLKECVEINYE